MISQGFIFRGIIMTSTKTRHDFLADADVTALLNELVQGAGVTKTEIIIQSVKAFAERGNDNEFAQRTAKRFDTLSRGLESVRQGLGTVRNDLESIRHDQKKMQSDVTMIYESLMVFVRCCMLMSGYLSWPNGENEAVENKRLRWFTGEVERKMAAATTPPPCPQEDKGAAFRETHQVG
jgi:hypothetical protein